MNQQHSQLASNSIFWVEVNKIKPNPYQPRRDFDPDALKALSESIRQYGVLQPLVVTRKEITKPDGGLSTEYELIAGERRLRASKLAGIVQVPVVIRTGEDDNLMKLELAIIENLQREDLNPVDRAKAFQKFIDEFGYKHVEIAKKVGKSREYVSNSLRLLSLSEEILDALIAGKITEGHARALMMLRDKPQEQMTLFKEVMHKKLSVRDAEQIARRNARDKIRKKSRDFNPEILKMEKELTEQLGTRVHIEPREVGGKITIDFFSDDDLKSILALINTEEENRTMSIQKEQEKVENDTSSVLEKLEMKKEIRESENYKNHVIPGTVAFGGSPKRGSEEENSSVQVKESQEGLGDVLRNVLGGAEEKRPEQKKESMFANKVSEKQDEPVATEEKPHEEPVLPARSHEEMQDMYESVFNGEEKSEENDDDGFQLPDTDDLRTEVNTLLADSEGVERDPSVDFIQRALDRKQDDVVAEKN